MFQLLPDRFPVARDRAVNDGSLVERVRVVPPYHRTPLHAGEPARDGPERVLPGSRHLTVGDVVRPRVLLQADEGRGVVPEGRGEEGGVDPAPLPVLGGLNGGLVPRVKPGKR